MNTIKLLAAVAAIGVATPSFAWTSINARQANQFARIQQGVRSGALTRAEAARLKSQFYALNRLEQRYRIGGLSTWERRDLDKRFDGLARRIYVQKNDRQGR